MNKKQKVITFLSKKRIIIQAVLGIVLYLVINYYNISLWWVLGFGVLTGIIWGKVFCQWMCPLGAIMGLIMKLSPDDYLKNMYQYHKIGCPIAWLSGLLNKISFYKIQLNTETCKDCGLCDEACYMSTLEKQKFSLYKPKFTSPAENFSCSKCLLCVAECPNGSLTYKAQIPFIKNKTIK